MQCLCCLQIMLVLRFCRLAYKRIKIIYYHRFGSGFFCFTYQLCGELWACGTLVEVKHILLVPNSSLYCHATARWSPSGWVRSLGFAEYSYRTDGWQQVHDGSHTFYSLLHTNQLLHTTNTQHGPLPQQLTPLCLLLSPAIASLKTPPIPLNTSSLQITTAQLLSSKLTSRLLWGSRLVSLPKWVDPIDVFYKRFLQMSSIWGKTSQNIAPSWKKSKYTT